MEAGRKVYVMSGGEIKFSEKRARQIVREYARRGHRCYLIEEAE